MIKAYLSYGTFLGGRGTDTILDCVSDSSGNTKMIGFSTSVDFPEINPFQRPPKSPLPFFSVVNSQGEFPLIFL